MNYTMTVALTAGLSFFIVVLLMPHLINKLKDLKPYLRPMSSMTDEERKEFIRVSGYEVEESVNGRHYEYYLKVPTLSLR